MHQNIVPLNMVRPHIRDYMYALAIQGLHDEKTYLYIHVLEHYIPRSYTAVCKMVVAIVIRLTSKP